MSLTKSKYGAIGAMAVQSDSSGTAGHALFAGQPRGLSTLFFAELWERFSYYGMRALLTLFVVAPMTAGGLGLTTVEAARIYGNYSMAVYLLAIPGGFIADRYLGARQAVLIGGSVIALGHYTLAIPAGLTFYIGLALVALGTGLFKPNISAMVGGLYGEDDTRRDAGFSIFYMGINVGALLAPVVTGFLAQSNEFRALLSGWGLDPAMSWHWGFGAAGVGMTFGLILFARQGGRLGNVGRKPETAPQAWIPSLVVIAGTLAVLGLTVLSDHPHFQWLRAAFLLVPVAAVVWFAMRGDISGQRLAAVSIFFIAAMVFWAIFEQAGITIALFGLDLTRNELFGWPFPPAWYQSLNPLFVILLAPLFAALWLRLGKHQPSSPVKFALGLFFLGLSFLLMVPAAMLTAEGRVSPLWLVGLFLLQTVGELLLSPVGLSTMTKLAPPHLVGLILGVWFLAASWGNKIAGILGSGYSAADPNGLAQFFLQQAAMVGVATLALFVLIPWLKQLMQGVR
jgi:POT family proton-dependent oligopeptide transporter